MRTLLLICCLTTISISCNSEDRESDSYNYGEIKHSTCDSNPLHHYHFSQVESDKDTLILMLALDAHGAGNMAVNRIKAACGIIPAFIVASDLIKNGFPDFETAIDDLIADVRSKHPMIGDKIVLVGFSGGARMAQQYALKHKLSGLLMLGAGPGTSFPNCKLYGLVGLADFNFMEVYRHPEPGQLVSRDYVLNYFNGGHEWPPTEELRDGLMFLCSGMNGNFDKLCSERSTQLMVHSDSLKGNPLMAWKSLEKAYQLEPDEHKREQIKANVAILVKDQTYKVGIESRELFLQMEYDLMKQYMVQIDMADIGYWQNEISHIMQGIAFSSNTYQIEHNKRLKGFLGILFYSRLQKLSKQKGNEPLKKTLLQAFAILEPENPDMLFFKSLYFSNLNQLDSAAYYLELSKMRGFQE